MNRNPLPRQAASKTFDILKVVQPLVNKGMMPSQIAKKTGYTTSQVSHVVRRYAKKPADYYTRHGNLGVSNTICLDEADPSILTPEQLEMARRVGITPGRFAWMVMCPRDTSVVNNRKNVTKYA